MVSQVPRMKKLEGAYPVDLMANIRQLSGLPNLTMERCSFGPHGLARRKASKFNSRVSVRPDKMAGLTCLPRGNGGHCPGRTPHSIARCIPTGGASPLYRTRLPQPVTTGRPAHQTCSPRSPLCGQHSRSFNRTVLIVLGVNENEFASRRHRPPVGSLPELPSPGGNHPQPARLTVAQHGRNAHNGPRVALLCQIDLRTPAA